MLFDLVITGASLADTRVTGLPPGLWIKEIHEDVDELSIEFYVADPALETVRALGSAWERGDRVLSLDAPVIGCVQGYIYRWSDDYGFGGHTLTVTCRIALRRPALVYPRPTSC